MNHLITFALTILITCALVSLSWAEQREDDRPNFIVIFADDLGYADLGCYGGRGMSTPELDEMARQGRRFSDFYVASPTCTPSRAALLTGCYPLRAGFNDAIAVRPDGSLSPSRVLWPGSPLGIHPDEVTIAEILQAAGYATGMVGKWHLGDRPRFNPLRHGFDSFFGVLFSNDMAPFHHYRGLEQLEQVDRDQQVQTYTRESLAFIDDHADEPFFLYLAHTMPHTPLAVSEEFRGRAERGLYGDVVAEIDWSVGQILDRLLEHGIAEETMVIFTSDNGPWLKRGQHGGLATPLRGGKGSTHEGGMRVPCLAWRPGTIPAGTTCTEIATTMDILPTFAHQAGAAPPKDRTIDGHDITPLLKAAANATTPYEYLLYYFGNELHAVRSGRWKLRLRNHLRNDNIYNYTAPKDVFLPAALYDLHFDPGEQKSVLGDHPQVVKQLQGYLAKARADLGDSLTGVEPTNIRATGDTRTAGTQ